MTRTQFMKFRRRDKRKRWYRRLFLPAVLIGPFLLVAALTLASGDSFSNEIFRVKARMVASEYGARIVVMSPFKAMHIAIPDDLTNETARGIHDAAQLFHRLCSLGGPDMELFIQRINPDVELNGGWAPGYKDSGEQFKVVHRGIPSGKNPMTLAWAEVLINGDPFE